MNDLIEALFLLATTYDGLEAAMDQYQDAEPQVLAEAMHYHTLRVAAAANNVALLTACNHPGQPHVDEIDVPDTLEGLKDDDKG